jgi:hypothetical protein
LFIGAVNVPRFASRGSESAPLHLQAQGSDADYILPQYYWHSSRAASPIFENAPIDWEVTNGNGNTANKRWQQIKKAKDCPVPRSETNT